MDKYDVIIIGGGPAGLVVSKFLVAFGKKVALIEKEKLGGDCTHTGCVPSKTLLKAANAYYESQHLDKYGITLKKFDADNSHVFSHVKQVVNEIYAHETPDIFRDAGVHVIEGKASFQDKNIIEVNNQLYKANQYIIATGSSAFVPQIDGIDDIKYLTNENIFDLNTLPTSLIIVGSGVIAIEMATAFNRLGSQVTVVSRGQSILKGNDSELSNIIKEQLISEGVKFIDNASLLSIKQKKSVKLCIEVNSEIQTIKASQIMFATGRVANTNLNLEKAGIHFDEKGIKVNDYLQTSQAHIYAIGDVSTLYQFTHIAEQEAILVGKNIVMPFKKKMQYEHIGWSIYTTPELAHLGLTHEQAQKQYGQNIICQSFEYKNLDRGYTDRDKIGKIKVILKPNGKILGASILGSRAGELIHILQVAKTFDMSFDKLSHMVYIYPTYADLIKQSSKQFYIQKLYNNPWLKLIKKIVSWFKKG